MPAHVVRRVQGAAVVAGDDHRLPDDVDHRDPARLGQAEVVEAGRRRTTRRTAPGPARAANVVGVDVHLPRQGGLQPARDLRRSAIHAGSPPRAATR